MKDINQNLIIAPVVIISLFFVSPMVIIAAASLTFSMTIFLREIRLHGSGDNENTFVRLSRLERSLRSAIDRVEELGKIKTPASLMGEFKLKIERA